MLQITFSNVVLISFNFFVLLAPCIIATLHFIIEYTYFKSKTCIFLKILSRTHINVEYL